MGRTKVKSENLVPDIQKPKSHLTRTVTHDIECPIGKREAAEILGISTDTLDQWTATYGIPHIKYDMHRNRGNRGKVLYLPSDLLEFRDKFRVDGRNIEEEVEEMLAHSQEGPVG